MNKLALLVNTYRRYGFRGAKALIRYYVAKRRAMTDGPGRQCPVCGWNGPEFFPIVHPGIGACRVKAACPSCGALERHRALWFFYREFFRSHPFHAHALHFSPERCFRALFASHAQHYFTSNFDHEASDVRLDLGHLGLMDESIDIIIATSVVTQTDVAIAIDEIHRVLRPGGFVLICEPVILSGHSQDLPHRPMGMRHEFGELDLERHFRGFDVALLDIVGFVPEADRERLGIHADNFSMIQIRKPERHHDRNPRGVHPSDISNQ